MAGARLHPDGIDFQDTNWKLEIDEQTDEMRLVHKPTGNSVDIQGDGTAVAELLDVNTLLAAQLGQDLEGDGNDITGLARLAADVAEATDEQVIPRYDSTAAAPEKEGSIIKVPSDGTDTEGVYHYSPSAGGYELLDESGGVSAGSLSGLSIDTDKDWGGFSITNLASIQAAVATLSDAPADMGPGEFVYVEDEDRYYYEDGS